MWEAFITRRDRIVAREHATTIQNQKKFDIQLQKAQLPAGQQIDNRIDKNLAGLDAKVKRYSQKSIHQKGGNIF